MSELRDELEAQFASAETQSDNAQNVNGTEEQAGNAVANADEWLNAPAAYTQDRKDNFKNLPQDWRKYLIEREKQVEKGFSDFGNKVNGYKYVDDLFNSRQDRFKARGFNNAKEVIDYFTLLDDCFEVDKKATYNELGKIYGITDGNVAANSNNNELLTRLNAQERQLQQLNQALQGDRIKREIDAFVSTKDDAGNPKYPYFEEVKQNIGMLMDRGVCKTLEEAYNQATWGNAEVRKKMLEAQQQADLTAKHRRQKRLNKPDFRRLQKQRHLKEN